MKKNILFFLFTTILSVNMRSQVIYNAYARVTNYSGTSFTVANLTEPTSYSFAVGGNVILMQMQDHVIGTNTTNIASFGDIANIQSAGLWEQKTITAITRSGTNATITLNASPINTYNTGNNSRFQIISFIQLSAAAFTTSNNITATAWNGDIGGIVAIEVGTDLILQHSITTNSIGFRGGVASNNNSGPQCTAASSTVYTINDNQRGFKGEGIYRSTDNTFNNARAKIANGGGGGNHHNGGGGGGGNWTAGGLGGNGYNNCTTNPGGGQGGLSLATYIVNNRIFMGGGGGGPQKNDGGSTNGRNGGNGGGIIIIKANRLVTGATCTTAINITANGQTVLNGGNDGQGGGGAAGTIVLQVNSFSLSATCPVTISANGGNGGSSVNGAPHAGGGGGAQGVVVFSTSTPTTNILVSANNGTPGCNNNSSPCNNIAGAPTGTNGSGILSPIGGFLPIELLSFKAQKQGNHVLLIWETSSETNNDYFTIEKSADALSFNTLEKIKTKAKNGNSSKAIAYSVKDLSPYNGTSYYRLKQTDLNGATKLHQIVSVNNPQLSDVKITVYPNPNNGNFTIDFSGIDKSSDLDILLYDISGKQLYAQHLDAGFDTNTINIIPSDRLTAGVYICNIISQGVKFPVKVVVQ
jgi:hypothetical protein